MGLEIAVTEAAQGQNVKLFILAAYPPEKKARLKISAPWRIVSKPKNKPGQGRPVTLTERKMYSLRLPIEMMDRIEGNKTKFIIDCVYNRLSDLSKCH